jgi:hypothetical protein
MFIRERAVNTRANICWTNAVRTLDAHTKDALAVTSQIIACADPIGSFCFTVLCSAFGELSSMHDAV